MHLVGYNTKYTSRGTVSSEIFAQASTSNDLIRD